MTVLIEEVYKEVVTLRLRVKELEDALHYLYQQENVEYYVPPTENIDARILAAIKMGNLIEAIKVYREINHCSLELAKTEVEKLAGK